MTVQLIIAYTLITIYIVYMVIISLIHRKGIKGAVYGADKMLQINEAVLYASIITLFVIIILSWFETHTPDTYVGFLDTVILFGLGIKGYKENKTKPPAEPKP